MNDPIAELRRVSAENLATLTALLSDLLDVLGDEAVVHIPCTYLGYNETDPETYCYECGIPFAGCAVERTRQLFKTAEALTPSLASDVRPRRSPRQTVDGAAAVSSGVA